jgi:hypothetical protein
MEQAGEPEQAACPVCRGATDLFDVVDFNKNCEEARGVYLPLSGTGTSLTLQAVVAKHTSGVRSDNRTRA